MADLGIAGVLVLLAGTVGGVFSLRAVLRRIADPVVRRLIVAGLLAKLVGSGARYTVMGDLYGGRGDFNRYFTTGRQIAAQIRSGSLPEQARDTGTPFMDFVAGVVFTVVPNRLWVGFLVFALLSFVGALLFLQAFRLAIPNGNHRLYAALVFFTPTMVFWPSSIGKEAWLVFGLGVAAYGAARVLRRGRFGFLIAALGGSAVFLVRPHMGALFGLAFAGAFALRFRDTTVRRSAAAWAIGFVIVGIGAGYAAANFGEELPTGRGVEEATLDAVAEETQRRTTTGGSEFDSRPVRNPADFVHAAITVPFRPFPMEGHNVQAQLAGLEGILLLLLILVSLPRLTALPRALLRQPYLALAGAYSVGFIIAFSNVGNFGILTRQRAQLLPFLFVLLAFRWKRAREERGPVLVPASLEEQAALVTQHATEPASTSSTTEEDPGSARDATTMELLVELPEGSVRAPSPSS